METKPELPENLDKIFTADPGLEAERNAKRGKQRQHELSNPRIDILPPIDPRTDKRVDLLPGRPEKSSYPGKNPPRPMPKGGATDD